MAGACVTGVEVIIARLVAPYFGTSLLVWNSILAIILIALGIGHYVGGRISDRCFIKPGTFGMLMLWTSIYMTVLPFAAKYLLSIALQGINSYLIVKVIVALVIVILMVVVPFVSLGVIKPYALKQQADQYPEISKRKIVGVVLMVSNLGCLLGIVVSTLVIAPLLGAYRGMLVFAAVLMMISVSQLKKQLLFLLPILPLALTIFSFKVKPEEGVVYETESAYNYIQVVKHDETFALKLNEGHAVHSFYNPDKFIYFGEWDYATVVALFNEGKSLLLLGLGCGTMARAYAHFVPEAQIDGVEIDPSISKVADSYFGLKTIPRLSVINQDARVYLATTNKCYDNIVIDAYKQPYIPFHLTSKEFFQKVKEHLNPKGVVGINVGATEEDSQILLMICNTMASVFKHVYSIRNYGSLQVHVWASDSEVGIGSINLDRVDEGAALLHKYIGAYYKHVLYNENCIVLRDDLAPVETYTEKMIIDFAKKQIKK